MLNGTQKRLGYREVIFNVNSKSFVSPLPGDNYEPLPIQSGEGGEVSTFGTGDINLETPTVTVTSLPDTTGLQTQQDFNIWAVAALESLASSGDGGGGGGVGTIAEVLAEGNETDFGQHLKFRSTADSIPPVFREQLLPDGTEIDFSGGSGYNVGPLFSYHIIAEPFQAEAGGNSVDVDYAWVRQTAVDSYYRSESNGESTDASIGLTGVQFYGSNNKLNVTPWGVEIVGGMYQHADGTNRLEIYDDEYDETKIICRGKISGDTLETPELVLVAPNDSKWKVTVDEMGNLSTELI